MKKTGRFFSIIISVMTFMTFCLSNFSASAADNDYKITVKNTNTAVSISGKTFYAYKIFSLTYENECYTYSTDSTCIDRQYSGYDPKLRNCTEVIESIKDESNARKFGDWVYNTYIKDGYVGDAFCSQATVPLARETVDIELEDAGYWLVFGTGDNKYGYEGSNTVTSLVMLGVASPTITVNPKFDAPSLDKEIYHNDNEENPWGVVGDNQIGDTVKFRLLSYIPDINGYSSYTYTIHDTLSAGLTYDTGSLSVKIDDDSSDILSDTYYTVAVEGQKIDITFDIKTAIANKVIKPKQKLYKIGRAHV